MLFPGFTCDFFFFYIVAQRGKLPHGKIINTEK